MSNRFPGIVLTGLISKLLLKLQLLYCKKNCTATRSKVLLASVNSKPFHVNKNNSSLRTGARWCYYFSFWGYCDSCWLRNNITINFLFCFCGESSTTSYNCSDCLNVDLTHSSGIIKDPKFLLSNWLLTVANNGLLPRGGSRILFFYKDMEVCIAPPVLYGPLSLRIA